jgi:tRNA uracil 4-sulfurtransferase
VGTAGRGMLMLSGGLDSPVAGYRMAKRGLRQEAVYFHAYPYTSDEAKEKVITLSKIISPYCSGITLHVVPFTDVQLHIKAHSNMEENTLLMRACMVRIANALAVKRNCKCIVTGEALSQVASQTLESLAYTDSMSDLPVFRPLIGMDKEEIVITARKIGTYETSILPFEDCCTIFSPKHPLVRPIKEVLTASYHKLEIEALLTLAMENEEMFDL